jgi:hypothetical protein
MTADVAPTGTKSLDEISQSVADVSQKLAVLKSKMNPSTSAENSPSAPATSVSGRSVSPVVLTTAPTTPIVATVDISSTTDNTNQTADVFIAPSSPGIITRIFSWPIAGFNFIRNLFVEH